MIEKRYIFFPRSQMVGNPSDLGLSYKEVRFKTEDGVELHGWFVPGTQEQTWIWFHGNAGNISYLLENLALLHHHLSVNFFLFDYREYGTSDGKVSEAGTYLDAQGARDYIVSRQAINPDKIIYFGQSLGSAVAIWLATQREPYGLIIEAPFSSMRDMAKRAFPRLPVYLLVRTKYNSLDRIGGLKCPLLVLHGDQDEVVPISQGKKLYEAAKGPKHFVEIPGSGHCDAYLLGPETYIRALSDFMATLER